MSNLDEYDTYLSNLFLAVIHNEVTEWNGERTLSVTFTITKKAFDQYRKSDNLGRLYATDLSNYLSRKGILREYSMPVVNDRARCVKGIKRIEVIFRLKALNHVRII